MRYSDIGVAAERNRGYGEAKLLEQHIATWCTRMSDPVPTPWGKYEVVAQGCGYLVKVITVNPWSRTSLRVHRHREESWTVVRGTLRVWWDVDHSEEHEQGAVIHVMRGETHRIDNSGPEPVVLIEVQVGHDLREDDIIRIQDDYGR